MLPDSEIKHIQKAVSIASYHTAALDNTSLIGLNNLEAAQSKSTQSTKNAVVQLLDHLSTHLDGKIRHYKSSIILQIHSDVSYLSEPNARSRPKGFFFLTNNPVQPDYAKLNDAIHVLCKIIKTL